MRSTHRRTNRGVTLTELLVVMLIISLLATVAVPVYVNRAENARVAIANAECREIAQAEEQCAILHGFYVPFQVLDDTPALGPNLFVATEDSITQDATINGNTSVINPLIRPFDQLGRQPTLNQYTVNSRLRSMVLNWQGPFLNPQRVYLGNRLDLRPGNPDYFSSPWFRLDFPLDPWGTPYALYSPLGIVGSNAYNNVNVSNYNLNFSDGLLTNVDNRFLERYAVVSFGRDSISETLNATNDRNDIVYLFGVAGVESTFAFR